MHNGPGPRALARFLLAALLLAGPTGADQAAAQARATVPAQPVPDPSALAKLVWSTMAAVDHANRTGNYTVLRELGAPSFQANNSPTALAQIFSNIRRQRLDLSAALLAEPVYEVAPAVQGDLMRIRGAFRVRPTFIQFDLLYQWNGEWKLFGIAVNTVPMNR